MSQYAREQNKRKLEKERKKLANFSWVRNLNFVFPALELEKVEVQLRFKVQCSHVDNG